MKRKSSACKVQLKAEYDITQDTLFNGQLICQQYKSGYRFSVDAVLVAHFTDAGDNEIVLDLGCGCGVISLIYLYRNRGRSARVVGLEIQPDLALLARHNGEKGSLADAMQVMEGDICNIKKHFAAGSFTTVLCNPPFYPVSSGRVSKNHQQLLARHQVAANLDDFVLAASFCLQNRGKTTFIYPAESLDELLSTLRKHRLVPKTMQLIYSYPGHNKDASLVIVKAVKNGGKGMKVLSPFYIYAEKDGSYSQEMEKLYAT